MRRIITAIRTFAETDTVAFAAALFLLFLAVVALAAPLLAPGGSFEQVGAPFTPPSSAHPLGLDDSGTDMLAVLIWGSRTSLLVGISAAAVSTFIGGSVGLAAGYFGGVVDATLMRVTDYFLVIPVVPLMMVVAAIWGPSLTHIILIIGLLLWTNTARVVRAQVKTERTRLYVRRAEAIGARHSWILRSHLLPTIAPLLVATGILGISGAIFSEAALSFLGLGDPQTLSWGQEIAHAFERTAISAGAWWEVVPPGVCIALVVLASHLVAEPLEQRLAGGGPARSRISASLGVARRR